MADKVDVKEPEINLEELVKEAKTAEDFKQGKEAKTTRVGSLIINIYSPKESKNFSKLYGNEKEGTAWQIHFAPEGKITVPEKIAERIKNSRILLDNMRRLANLSRDEEKGFKSSRPNLVFGLTPNKEFALILERFGFTNEKKDDHYLVVNKNPDILWDYIDKRTTREIVIPTQEP